MELTADELVRRVLYRDALMLVLDMPAGLAVHVGPEGGPNLDTMMGALRFGLPRAPRLAHRLDRATRGCLVLGRHRQALDHLWRPFAAGHFTKTYWAVVEGRPPDEAGTVDLALGRRSDDPRSWWMKVGPAGQPAITDYRVRGVEGGLSWIELSPRTGRTHQIRVHCAALGCPLLGDAIYGAGGTEPLHLYARAVAVPLYASRPAIEVTAPVPAHMAAFLARLGLREVPPDGAGC